MSLEALQQLVNETPKIATLPSVYTELSAVLSSRHVNATQIAGVVSVDPGLTVRLLKMVNSSFYGFDQYIDTVSHAVSLIGHRQLKELALATTVVHMFRAMPEHLINMDSYWRHSVATAIAARALGRMMGMSKVEYLFVTGLLHGVGSLVVCINRPHEARRVFIKVKNSGDLLHHVEAEVLGFNHADVGGALMKNWGLALPQVEAVKYKHRPDEAPNHGVEAAILHVSNVVASALNMGSVGDVSVPSLNPWAWETLGLRPEAMKSLVWEIEDQFEELVSALTRG
jgi:HD-like signal output (HDOD) protein